LREYESLINMGHSEVFISEILNSTDIALASGIDPALISFLPDHYIDETGEGSFILIDPSSGKKHGDDCTIGHFEVLDGTPVFDELILGTFTPKDTIKHAITLGLRRNTRLIGVEDVAYQSTLLFWFEEYCKEEGITGFVFVPIPPRNQAKNSRIKKGFTKLCPNMDGVTECYLHPNVRSLAVSQYVEWNPLKIDNTDDIIDLVGYVEYVLMTHPEDIVRNIFQTVDLSTTATHTSDLQLPF
jgi:hypothetical protein